MKPAPKHISETADKYRMMLKELTGNSETPDMGDKIAAAILASAVNPIPAIKSIASGVNSLIYEAQQVANNVASKK